MARIYSHLSQVYDLGWGDFSKQYVSLINGLLEERSIARARILDLACGTGTLAIELARSGHFVQGIDISPEMIRIAKSKSPRLLKQSFKVADLTSFPVKGKFDLVTCTFDSINYLVSIDDLREAINRIAYALIPSGLFVFDSNTKRLYQSYHQETQKRSLGGQSLIQCCNYDPVSNEATVEFLFPDGNTEVHKQRPYDRKELEPIMSNAGFRILKLLSWFDGRSYSSKTEKLFCIAEKK
ncbi:class I SAM-dependent DNA methyltransferase [Chloroflexota bacterium]